MKIRHVVIAMLGFLFLLSSASAAPKCMPTLYGEVVPPTNVVYTTTPSGQNGFFGTLYCRWQDPAGKWWITGHTSYCLVDLAPKCDWALFVRNFVGAKMNTDSEGAAKSYWDANVRPVEGKCAGTSGAEYEICRQAFVAMCNGFPVAPKPAACSEPEPGPAPPPSEAWKVLRDPFRADGKRLIYSVVNGKRGASTGQYIDAGAPCDPSLKIEEYGGVFFLAVPGGVARCSK